MEYLQIVLVSGRNLTRKISAYTDIWSLATEKMSSYDEETEKNLNDKQ